MNKAEYMFKLNSGLQKYPESFRKQVVESFESYYQESLHKGKSSSKALHDFGSPEYVLSEIKRLFNDESDPASKLDQVWTEKNRALMKEMTDYRMGASIAIPAIFFIFLILHYFHII